MTHWRRDLLLAASTAIALGLLTALFVLRTGPHDRHDFFVEGMDFRAYYCAGKAVLQHRDPFRIEPVRSCEHDALPNENFNAEFPPWAGMPAPYPGYVLALFAIFANAKFIVAKAIWDGILVAALVVSAFTLSRITRVPLLLVSLALIPTALLHNLTLGAAPPIAIAGLSLAALAVTERKPALAGPAMVAAMIDPQLALPSAIVLLLIAPAARLAVAFSFAALGALSLLTIGLAGNLEYFLEMVPMQARAEVIDRWQYSLVHVLSTAGLPAETSLTVGSVSYLVLAVLGIVFAMREPRDGLGPARAILLPVAFVALGGTYLHHQQISMALPAAIILLPYARTRTQRILLSIAFIGLLFSPSVIDGTREGIFAYVVACGAVAAWIWAKRRLPAFAIAGAIAGGLVLGIRALPQVNVRQTAFSVRPDPQPLDRPSNREWTDFLAASPSVNGEDLNSAGSKLPTWCGLISLVIVAASTQQRVTRSYLRLGAEPAA